MCLIVLAYRQHPRYRLIVAANRDEYYRRPAAPAHFWPERPDVLAGRDLEQLGTWMGITRTGRFAALTNYRDPSAVKPGTRSRGRLVSDYLCGQEPPQAYLCRVAAESDSYNGFNLLVGDWETLFYFSSRTGRVEEVSPGIHGLSNHLLDTPWPKVVRAKSQLAGLLGSGDISPEGLFDILRDTELFPDGQLPDTGVGLEWERLLAPVFIVSPDYGTRANTVLLQEAGGKVAFFERTLPDNSEVAYEFNIP